MTAPQHAREGRCPVRQLGQLEAAVMERLWSWQRPATVREVLADLQQERDIAYTTVMTVMDNLHRKGVLGRELHGRAYRYHPLQSRDEHVAALMGQLLAGSSDRAAALLHFVEQMPPGEVERLRAALGGRGQKRRSPR